MAALRMSESPEKASKARDQYKINVESEQRLRDAIEEDQKQMAATYEIDRFSRMQRSSPIRHQEVDPSSSYIVCKELDRIESSNEKQQHHHRQPVSPFRTNQFPSDKGEPLRSEDLAHSNQKPSQPSMGTSPMRSSLK